MILVPLLWLSAFLREQSGTVRRVFSLDAYIMPELGLQFLLDASPWGFGGVLCVNHVPVEYFAEAMQSSDTEVLDISVKLRPICPFAPDSFISEWRSVCAHKQIHGQLSRKLQNFQNV